MHRPLTFKSFCSALRSDPRKTRANTKNRNLRRNSRLNGVIEHDAQSLGAEYRSRATPSCNSHSGAPGRVCEYWNDIRSCAAEFLNRNYHAALLLAAFLVGLLGLACLWISLVVSPQRFVHRHRLRIGLACGILLGIADALYCLLTLRKGLNSLGPSGWATWLLMLAGPIIVGTHQFVRLIRPKEAPVEGRSGSFS